MMTKCGYLAWWLWTEVKLFMLINHCEDGPHCGCPQHRPEGDDDGYE